MLFWGDPGCDGQRRPHEFRPAWPKALEADGIVILRSHDLRHEAVSPLVEVGLGDQEASTSSGYRSMQMLHRYTFLSAEDLVTWLDWVGYR